MKAPAGKRLYFNLLKDCFPFEEGLVFKAEDFVYSSAIDYAGEKGILDVFVIK